MTKAQAKVYKAGYKARTQSLSKAACEYGQARMEQRCLWLAGWNDKDREVTS